VSGLCRELRPLLGAYVLGALEPEEAAAVRTHLASCPACAAEHARLAPLPGLLTLAGGATLATAEPPPPALEERLLDAVAAEGPQSRPRRRPRPLGRRRWPIAAGAAAISVAAAAALLALPGDAAYGPEIPLRAATAPRGATAYAELRPVAGGTAMQLNVTGLPGNPAAVYEVRCDGRDWSATAGTFRVDARGRATVVLTSAARRGEYDHIRVLRRTGGAPQVIFDAALS
jgi:hypothetical protein